MIESDDDCDDLDASDPGDDGDDDDCDGMTFGFCRDPNCIMTGMHLIPTECHSAEMMQNYYMQMERDGRK